MLDLNLLPPQVGLDLLCPVHLTCGSLLLTGQLEYAIIFVAWYTKSGTKRVQGNRGE